MLNHHEHFRSLKPRQVIKSDHATGRTASLQSEFLEFDGSRMVIEHHSLARQIYREIKRRILTSEMACGEQLHVDLFANELKVSQSSVKEALKQLENEGLVEIRPRSSTVARSSSRREVIELYATRAVLEPAAAALWCTRAGGQAGASRSAEAKMERCAGRRAGGT